MFNKLILALLLVTGLPLSGFPMIKFSDVFKDKDIVTNILRYVGCIPKDFADENITFKQYFIWDNKEMLLFHIDKLGHKLRNKDGNPCLGNIAEIGLKTCSITIDDNGGIVGKLVYHNRAIDKFTCKLANGHVSSIETGGYFFWDIKGFLNWFNHLSFKQLELIIKLEMLYLADNEQQLVSKKYEKNFENLPNVIRKLFNPLFYNEDPVKKERVLDEVKERVLDELEVKLIRKLEMLHLEQGEEQLVSRNYQKIFENLPKGIRKRFNPLFYNEDPLEKEKLDEELVLEFGSDLEELDEEEASDEELDQLSEKLVEKMKNINL